MITCRFSWARILLTINNLETDTVKLTLYTAPGSIGVASHIALEESGLDFELVTVDTANKEQLSQKYLQINPKARVPSLIVEDSVLTETPAILAYLAQLAPESSLAFSGDQLAFAQVQAFNSYLCSTVHVAHAHKHRGSRWTDDNSVHEKLTAFVPVSMGLCFDLIEAEMIKGPWVHGESFSISDPYLFAICLWLEGDGVQIVDYPQVQAHYERMLKRASVQVVLALKQAR